MNDPGYEVNLIKKKIYNHHLLKFYCQESGKQKDIIAKIGYLTLMVGVLVSTKKY